MGKASRRVGGWAPAEGYTPYPGGHPRHPPNQRRGPVNWVGHPTAPFGPSTPSWEEAGSESGPTWSGDGPSAPIRPPHHRQANQGPHRPCRGRQKAPRVRSPTRDVRPFRVRAPDRGTRCPSVRAPVRRARGSSIRAPVRRARCSSVRAPIRRARCSSARAPIRRARCPLVRAPGRRARCPSIRVLLRRARCSFIRAPIQRSRYSSIRAPGRRSRCSSIRTPVRRARCSSVRAPIRRARCSSGRAPIRRARCPLVRAPGRRARCPSIRVLLRGARCPFIRAPIRRARCSSIRAPGRRSRCSSIRAPGRRSRCWSIRALGRRARGSFIRAPIRRVRGSSMRAPICRARCPPVRAPIRRARRPFGTKVRATPGGGSTERRAQRFGGLGVGQRQLGEQRWLDASSCLPVIRMLRSGRRRRPSTDDGGAVGGTNDTHGSEGSPRTAPGPGAGYVQDGQYHSASPVPAGTQTEPRSRSSYSSLQLLPPRATMAPAYQRAPQVPVRPQAQQQESADGRRPAQVTKVGYPRDAGIQQPSTGFSGCRNPRMTRI